MNHFFITLIIAAWSCNSFAQSVNHADWIEDINFYKTNLEEKHIDVYNNISQSEFNIEIQKILSAIESKSELDIIIDLMRLTQKIGDGHTALSLRGVDRHFYPFEIYKVHNQWRVIKATKKYKNLLGKILTRVEEKEIKSVATEVSQVAQYIENKQSADIRTGEYMMISELLFGLGITQSATKSKFTFLDESTGEEKDIILQAINHKDYYEKSKFESFQISTPEIQKPADSKHDFLWFSPIKGTDGIYIKFESYPSFEEMENFSEKTLHYINENNIKQIAIDLRNNGGGDFFVGTFLAYYLNLADGINWKSGVYVLTDKFTFSAATINASQFQKILNAKIVGEPTGSNPTGYQDMGQFTLPNSGMTVTYSKRLFKFQEHENDGIQPDVLISYDWSSYSNGKDNMMEWIINDLK